MNLPIPEVSDFFAGFASCAALTVAVVAFAHVKTSWPAIKATAGTIEQKFLEDLRTAVNAAHAKVDQLSNAAASAINAVRGDVKSIQDDIATVRTRLSVIESDVMSRVVALEKAVGIVAPPFVTVEHAAPIAGSVNQAGAGGLAPELHNVA